MTIGVHVTLVNRWLDPAETEGLITPFMVLYPIHDALVKPMPGGLNTPCLAESWTVSKDGLTYEFVLRKNAKFHNGDPVTAEDVKFSFDRYRGSGAKLLKEKVKEVQVAPPNRVRIVLKEPWPDFMAFYGTSATGAGWIVPKKYVEKVGDDGFKKAPVGAGPFKVVSFNPGIELVLEAFAGYWRKTPGVKRLVMKSIPDESTRAAALKAGEVDIAYLFGGHAGRGAAPRAGPEGRRRPSSTASTGSTSWTSGSRSRRGTTAACAWPPASPWIGRPSTRSRCSGWGGPPAPSCRPSSTSP